MQSIGVTFLENAAATSGYKFFAGGKAAFVSAATGSGTVKLQLLTKTGTTVDLVTHSADASTVVDLPPGQYRAAVATFTAVYADLIRIPA